MLKSTLVMLLYCSINTQSFAHDKSRSTSQFIKGKSRDLQKLLIYLSGKGVSTFKHGPGGCGGQMASPSLPGRAGLFGVFPTIFVLYSNDLPSKGLSSLISSL